MAGDSFFWRAVSALAQSLMQFLIMWLEPDVVVSEEKLYVLVVEMLARNVKA